MKEYLKTTAVASIIALALPGSALAATYGFDCITENSAGDCSIAEDQTFLQVTGSDSLASFTISNTGSEDSSLATFYWDDDSGILLDFSSIVNGTGVDIDEGANGGPVTLPGGTDVGFNEDFTAGATPPPSTNGVNPNETVTFNFDLASGYLFSDVLAALDSGNLSVGIHVIGFESGGSESIVNTPAPIPLPAAGWMLLAGVGGLAAMKRRKKAQT